MQVTYKQQEITFRPKEYALLQLFLQHPQRIFSRNTIIDQLWSIDQSPTEAAVTTLIKDLRRRLKAAGITEEVIETVHGLGYRLTTAPTVEKSSSPTSLGKSRLPGCESESKIGELPKVSEDSLVERFRVSLKQRLRVLEEMEVALHHQLRRSVQILLCWQ